MRRFDSSFRASDSVYLPHVSMTHPLAQLGQMDQATASFLFGDLVEDRSNDWQKFWIDIGGEG